VTVRLVGWNRPRIREKAFCAVWYEAGTFTRTSRPIAARQKLIGSPPRVTFTSVAVIERAESQSGWSGNW